MRTYTDFNAWKTACRARGWTGPTVIVETQPPEHQFTDDAVIQRAVWHSDTNTGIIPDEMEPPL